MTGYTRHTPIYLVDATDTPVGVIDRLGREWLFPASLTVGADGGSIGNLAFGQLLHDSTDTPIGYQVFGREFIFASPFTVNTTRGLRQVKRPLLLSAAGVPQGLFVRSGVASQFAALPVENGSSGGPVLPQAGSIVSQFSADSITPQTDNTALTNWTDTITGLSLTQGTGAAQPKYRTNRMGGKPSVQFAGSQWLSGSVPALKTAIDAKVYTVLIASSNVAAAAQGCMFGNTAGGTGCVFYCRNGTVIGQWNNELSSMVVNDPAPAAFATLGLTASGVAQYPGAQSGSSLSRVAVNGMFVTSNIQTASWLATSSGDGNFAIGAGNSAGNFSCKADIYEVIVWNRILTQNELIQAEIWMRNKYSQALPWAGATSIDVYDGDSIMAGVGSYTAMSAAPYIVAGQRGKALGQWACHAVGGMTIEGMTAKAAEWTGIAALTGLPVRVGAFEWYNEKNEAATYTTAYNRMVTYCSTIRATANTKLALGTSTSYNNDATDYLTTLGRKGYNDLLDTNNASMCDAYWPIHNDTNLGTYDAFTNHPTNFNADGVHLTPTSRSTYLAPLLKAGMDALGA